MTAQQSEEFENGGELLFLALATCYCNDLYREAAARGIRIEAVEVEVSGNFGGPGEPATAITYRAKVKSDASEAEISQLLVDTDRVAEIQNTVRNGCTVTLDRQVDGPLVSTSCFHHAC
jgi:organic hydroperoxide reductase OsmC/OhrA